jgi:hypothetical protein
MRRRDRTAAGSYHALELRVRFSPWLDGFPKQVAATGLALSLIGGLVLVPRILRTNGSVAAHSLDWKAAKDDIPALPDCSLANVERCTIVHGSGQHVLLLGDSNAWMYIPTLQKIAQQDGLTLSVAAGPLYPWQRGLYYLIGIQDCPPKHRDWYGAWWTLCIPTWSSWSIGRSTT